MAHLRTKEDFEDAVSKSYSIAGMCRHLGLKPCEGNYLIMHKAIDKYNLDISHFSGKGWNKGLVFKPFTKTPISKILISGSTFQSYKLKNRLLQEGIKQHICERCNLQQW